jgi:hypothetical protein
MWCLDALRLRERAMRCLWIGLVLATLPGCGPQPGPLVSGTFEGGTLWKRPLDSGSNEGFTPEKGSRVEVYDQFIVITTPNGLSFVRPHGTYSDLVFRRTR